jgi:hypothetical protein
MSNFEYLESDLPTAAFLVVRDFRLLGVEPVERGRLAFRFEDREGKARDAALEFLSGASVVARDFATAEKSLKTALYSAKGSPRNGNGNQYRNR